MQIAMRAGAGPAVGAAAIGSLVTPPDSTARSGAIGTRPSGATISPPARSRTASARSIAPASGAACSGTIPQKPLRNDRPAPSAPNTSGRGIRVADGRWRRPSTRMSRRATSARRWKQCP
jgi:hypothetical protein